MKKLLLDAVASLFSGAVFAQSETPTARYDDCGPKELTCTEKAISCRINIRSGWQLYSFRIGYTDVFNRSSGFIASQNYVEDDPILEPIQLVEFENRFNQEAAFANKNSLFQQKTLKSLTQANQLTSTLLFQLKAPN